MKKIILALLMGFCFLGAFGQVDPVVRSVRFEAQSEAEMNAIPANKLQEGSVCYREDTDSLWRYNGTTWAEMTGSGLANVVDDTTPQLGGTLDLNTNSIQGDIYPSADNTYDLGLPASSFANAYTFNSFIRHPSTAATDDYDWRFRTSPTTNNFEIGVEDAEGTGAYTTTYTLSGTGTPSAATDLIDKAYADANYGGGGSSPPFDDNSPHIRDNLDNTKTITIVADNITTATNRNLTMPDADVDLGALTSSNLATASVTTDEIANSTITATDIADNTITALKIGTGAVASDEILDGSITNGDLGNGIVTPSKISAAGGTNGQVLKNVSGTSVAWGTDETGTDDQTAGEVGITDAAGYYTGTDVEAMGQEIGSDLATKVTEHPDSGQTGVRLGIGTQAQRDAATLTASDAWICTNCKKRYVFTVPITAQGADIAVATSVTSFFTTRAITVTNVWASLSTAPTGSVATFDINEAGVSILSTKITIDATENTSNTAATPPVISDSAIAAFAELTFDVDGVGSTTPGTTGTIYIEYTVDNE